MMLAENLPCQENVGVIRDIVRVRANFIRHAVEKVQTLMSRGDRREVNAAADELGRYFEWVKDDFPPDVRAQLYRQICTVQRTATSHGSRG